MTPQAAAAGIAANPSDPGDAVGAGVSSAVDTAVARVLATAVHGTPVEDFPAPSAGTAFGSGSPGMPR